MSGETNAFCLWSVLSQLVSFLTGFFTAIFAEPIRQFFFKPNLELSFDNTDDFVSLTSEKSSLENKPIEFKAYYIRIRMTWFG